MDDAPRLDVTNEDTYPQVLGTTIYSFYAMSK